MGGHYLWAIGRPHFALLSKAFEALMVDSIEARPAREGNVLVS